ncbi:VPLPA-CTERM sorting domain-containing protein [Primorskyibacter sp. 2E107]|uniref:VPLPA-CTERM sorting domain-containing protein n=1 Tax=Primorskyibacter sp. 2E107 TaxID=3403458 RepID=UPI003AF83FBC
MTLIKTTLFSVLATAALFPVAASAATLTVSTSVDVTQRISYDKDGDPNYADPFSGEYVFWDEYIRILTEEANVWDASQIPTAPPAANPYDIESTGTIGFNFTFDPATLNTAALETGAFDPDTGANPTVVGATGTVNATITNAQGTSTEVVPGPMPIYASNNFATGDASIGTIDAIFVMMLNSTRPDGSTEVGFFAAGFDDNYFESLTGGTSFSWEDANLSYLEVRNSIHSFDGDPLYDEEVRGFGNGYSVTTGGAGGGLSPVPVPAALPLLLAGLGGLAMVRRRRKG